MKCSTCGAELLPPVRKDGVPYPCGLRNAVLNGVLVPSGPAGGEAEVAIPRIDGLHRVLALAVARKPGRLAPDEIRFLRKHLGWSGVDFAGRFRVTPQTVTRWERGQMHMNAQAELLLRILAPAMPPVQSYPTAGVLPDDAHAIALDHVLAVLQDAGTRDAGDPDTPIALKLCGTDWVDTAQVARC